LMPASIVVAERDQVLHAQLPHVAERSSAGRRDAWLHLITVWFPYRRRFLLVILDLSTTIAVRAVLTVIYPATAITMWTNLHSQHLSQLGRHDGLLFLQPTTGGVRGTRAACRQECTSVLPGNEATGTRRESFPAKCPPLTQRGL
jgi:hypothetical protein